VTAGWQLNEINSDITVKMLFVNITPVKMPLVKITAKTASRAKMTS
jgi:hypothetical protein